MSTYKVAKEIAEYYDSTRGVGHTSVIFNGASRNRCIVLMHTERAAQSAISLNRGQPNAFIVSMGRLENGGLRGNRLPMILDNATTHVVLSGLVSEIDALREETRQLRQKIDTIRRIL